MIDKKAIALLKKYYLPYRQDGQPSEAEKESAIKSGILVPDSSMTHDEIVVEIKKLAERISLLLIFTESSILEIICNIC